MLQSECFVRVHSVLVMAGTSANIEQSKCGFQLGFLLLRDQLLNFGDQKIRGNFAIVWKYSPRLTLANC